MHLIFTTGSTESEIWSNNGGEMLYHVSLSENEYRTLLNNYCFNVMHYTATDSQCGDATVWVAKKLKNK